MPLTDIECRTARNFGGRTSVSPASASFRRSAPYPAITLVAARKARDEARALVAGGIDPSEARQEAKAARIMQEAAADSFKAVAEGYVAKLKRKGRAPTTMKKIEWLLDFALADLGKFKIGEISSARGACRVAQGGGTRGLCERSPPALHHRRRFPPWHRQCPLRE
ncbi:integrase arm-type DNA-binding domain-containing protein [Labrys miyagiensis]|nr:integrase arm-type DNA-binding domain-containing protein [Labrys miyagiensis]